MESHLKKEEPQCRAFKYIRQATTLTYETASCHVGHTGTQLITEVKQRWAQLVLGWVTTPNDRCAGCC
jgi:hypothetical protein